MSKHTIRYTVPVHYKINSDESDTAYPTMMVTYNYRPARPAYTPPGEYAPIDPPEDAEIEVIAAEVVPDESDGVGDLTPAQALEWAERLVEGDDVAFFDFCEQAEIDRIPDPDDERDRRRDDALTDR